MGSQQIPCKNLPVEQLRKDIILNSPCEKIKRPPNAFMLFASDHRKSLAKQHPDVSNKEISVLLGRMWKDTPVTIKGNYHNKARIIKDMHLKQHPGYYYSPREARLNKMAKKRKKDMAFSKAWAKDEESEKNAEYNDNSKKDKAIDNRNIAASSSYVPNNSEYAIQPSPEMSFTENEEEQPSRDYDAKNQLTHSKMSFKTHMVHESRSCNRNATESSVCSIPLYRTQETPSYFSQNAHPTPSIYYNPTEYSGSLRPFCYEPTFCNEVPGSVPPPYYPYWKETVRPPLQYQGRADSHKNAKPYSCAAPYFSSEYYRPSVGYLDGIAMPYYRNSNLEFYPRLNADTTGSQASENEFLPQNSEARECLIKPRKEETLSPNFSKDSNYKDSLSTYNRTFLDPDCRKTGYLLSFIKQEPKGEMSNCFSHFPYASNRMPNEYEITDTRNCYNETIGVQYAKNIILENSNPNNLSEINAQEPIELSSFCEADSAMPQCTSYSSLLNNKLPRMQGLASQFKKESFDNFPRVFSPNTELSQTIRMNNVPTSISSEKPLNFISKNEGAIFEPKPISEAKTRYIKKNEVQNNLDANVRLNTTLNFPFSFPITSKTFHDQTNMQDSDAYSTDTGENIEII